MSGTGGRPRRPMRRGRVRRIVGGAVSSPAVVSLVVVGVAVVLLFGFRQQIASLVFQRTTTSGSDGVLVAMEDLAELETTALVRKTVFPHDFFLEGVSVSSLLDRIRDADRSASEVLSVAELLHFQAANLAAHVGMDASSGSSDFIVITTVARYGYDMDALAARVADLLSQPGVHRPSARDGAGEAVDGRPYDTVVVELPPAELLSLETEDISIENYPYRAVPLDAEEWRRVTTFVSDWMRRTPPDEDVIVQGTMIGRDLLQALVGGVAAPVRFVVSPPEHHR